jgi:hypothetical protein
MRLLVVLFSIGILSAQQPAPEAAKPKRAIPEPKNLQVLKIPHSELIPTMKSYSTALGVQCTFCHVQGNFASDDKPEKVTARRMITMVQDVNGKYFDSMDMVACYTCHRGEHHPQMAPPPASAPAAAPAPTPAPAPAP